MLALRSQDDEFISPEAIKPPPFRKEDSLPLPAATLLPSYILAGTNHFQQAEIAAAARSDPVESNLFVYGRLMFPTVLHAFALASKEGVYSTELRRRLHPTSADWAKADLSIKHTTQVMTPAILQGYDRWKPKGMNCAVIQDARLTNKIMSRQRDLGLESQTNGKRQGEVTGFLILSLRYDALRFCDLVFGGDTSTLRKMRPQTESNRAGEATENRIREVGFLQRRTVSVECELGEGWSSSVMAETYC